MVLSGAGGRADGREVDAGGPFLPSVFALLFEFFLPISVTLARRSASTRGLFGLVPSLYYRPVPAESQDPLSVGSGPIEP
jgi:hypothetical protein